MKRALFFLCGMLALCGCEAVKGRQLSGFWVNRNGASAAFEQKVFYLATFEQRAAEGEVFLPEDESLTEDFDGVYKLAYLSGGSVVAASVTEGVWRITYAPSETAKRSVYALDLKPLTGSGTVQRFDLSFDGDRLILADFQRPEVTVERYVRSGAVDGM